MSFIIDFILFIRKIINKITQLIIKSSISFYFRVRSKKIEINKDVVFVGYPIISIFGNSRIKIGSLSVLVSKKYANPLGLNNRTIVRTLKDSAEIIIGNNVGLSGTVICSMSRVEIGNNVGIGANSYIIDTDFHPINPRLDKKDWDNLDLVKSKPIKIGNNVMIGMNVVVLKGVEIGDNSVIGANTIISKNIPPNSIVTNELSYRIRNI